MNIKSCWLTINRKCNLHCKWCYAQNTDFDKNMYLPVAIQLIDICIDNNIRKFKLIGGEPTLHHNFFEIIKYIIDRECSLVIITNGIKLSDRSFCEKIKSYDNGKLGIRISLKGSSNDDYKKNCNNSVFDYVLKGIENCIDFGLKFTLSYVISSENINNIDGFAQEIKNRGINEHIEFSYCSDVLFEDEFCSNNQLHPLDIDNILNMKYGLLQSIFLEKFSLHQTLPLCMCNNDLFNKLKKWNQVMTTCHVHKRTGVVFDTNGSILLCNHIVSYGLGKLGKDYYDSESFKEFWDSPYVIGVYNKLVSMPSAKCLNM